MRLFIAATFPETVLRTLNERLATVKPKLPPASWVRPETQHLTFAFLGEQEESIIPKLVTRVSEMLRIPPFEATLHGCGLFPNHRHARVGWCGVEPENPFTEIASALRQAVRAEKVEIEQTEFKPHLTLMRIREHWPPLAVETFEKALRDYRSAPFAVGAITLYSSRLNPKGAIHTAVRQFPLG